MKADQPKTGCAKCHYTGLRSSEARHEDGSGRPAWAVMCDCMKKEALSIASKKNTELECYDAGHLNDFGGGNVGWWQDYIRAELERAHDHYQQQVDALFDGKVLVHETTQELREWVSQHSHQAHVYDYDTPCVMTLALNCLLSGNVLVPVERINKAHEWASDIEDKICRQELTTSQVFTRMRDLLYPKVAASQEQGK